ncbi:protein of unknown function [Nitrosotalea devaniterrae]|uniref:ArsA HSP20-like domain-containing protein n=1 Tax=Nitrosotalea devaniterrae TaxID=1078905 RepID=A0A128A4P6_9ARCH|nr:protein of unknown function [Candidatus Nitrosotalea devanaterra]
MGEIDDMVKDLDDLIAGLLNVTSKKNVTNKKRPLTPSLINISFNVMSHPLDETISDMAQQKLYPHHEKEDPLLDVIETEDQMRVIATLPGIKNEDVWFTVRNDTLTIEILTNGQILRKDITCNTKPERISIKSSKVNNSVLELVFDKK